MSAKKLSEIFQNKNIKNLKSIFQNFVFSKAFANNFDMFTFNSDECLSKGRDISQKTENYAK